MRSGSFKRSSLTDFKFVVVIFSRNSTYQNTTNHFKFWRCLCRIGCGRSTESRFSLSRLFLTRCRGSELTIGYNSRSHLLKLISDLIRAQLRKLAIFNRTCVEVIQSGERRGKEDLLWQKSTQKSTHVYFSRESAPAEEGTHQYIK